MKRKRVVYPVIQCVWFERVNDGDPAPLAVVQTTQTGASLRQDDTKREIDAPALHFITAQMNKITEWFVGTDNHLFEEIDQDGEW